MKIAHKTILTILNIFLMIWLVIILFVDFPGYGVMDNILLSTAILVILISASNSIAIHRALLRELYLFSYLQTAVLISMLVGVCLFGKSNSGYHDMGKIFYIPFGILLLIFCTGLNLLIFRFYKR
jgi:hypothetical protein